MAFTGLRLLDTTPRWLGLTFVLSSFSLVVVGVGVLFNQIVTFGITPFTLLLHLATAISLSAWATNLRINLTSERKSLLAIGVAVAVGSIWSSLQQWVGYLQTGLANDITLVAGAMLMDAAGGCVTYVLFHLNVYGRRRL